jgi:hypothetical protein
MLASSSEQFMSTKASEAPTFKCTHPDALPEPYLSGKPPIFWSALASLVGWGIYVSGDVRSLVRGHRPRLLGR